MKLLDLFCGRWGWSRAFAERGWECVGVDLVKPPEIPDGCRFTKANILDIFYDAHHSAEAFCINREPFQPDFICASSPCEKFSVHGMKHFHPNPPYPEMGIKLFNHTRMLCEAYGVPYVMENVRVAEQFVGRAVNHCGPFHLWGSGVPPLLHQGITKTKWTMNRKLGRDKPGNECPEFFISKKLRAAKLATIPIELSSVVADYAERLVEQRIA